MPENIFRYSFTTEIQSFKKIFEQEFCNDFVDYIKKAIKII